MSYPARSWARSLVIVAIGVAVAFAIWPRESAARPAGTGGGVHGSVYFRAQVGPRPLDIFLPDLKVVLHDAGSGTDSPAVTTDAFGRYAFPPQPAGTYELRWAAQAGWPAGKHSDPIVIGSVTHYPAPARVVADDRSTVVFGRVTFGGGAPAFYADEWFRIQEAATVKVSTARREAVLAPPVRANAEGLYAIAGLPRGEGFSVTAQAGAANTTRAVAVEAATASKGGVNLDIALPNRRPLLLDLVPVASGTRILTANPGERIGLRAIASDPDGDGLTFTWKVGPGFGKLEGTGADAQWTLPDAAGRAVAYAQVADGRGGYAQRQIDFVVGRKTARFSGRVLDGEAPVTEAVVSVGGVTGKSGKNGMFVVDAPLAQRYVVNARKPGYALLSRVFDTGADGLTLSLVRAQAQKVDPTKAIVLVDERPELKRSGRQGARVSVPAGALVDGRGAKPQGTLDAYLATYDLARGETPGDWGALEDGKEANLVSVGAGFVEFRDAAGTVFNLAPGTTARIDVPLAPHTRGALPPGTQLWSYDEADGFWKPAGKMERAEQGEYASGSVSHFSSFNADYKAGPSTCLKFLLYPPLPTGIDLRITDPTGTVFSQAYQFTLHDGLNAAFRVPANTNVKLDLFDANSVLIPDVVLEEVPGTALPTNVVNTGPPATTPFPPEPYEPCKLVILRQDVQTTPSVFLTFKGVGDAATANGYYAGVDPNGLRTTLGQWWTTNGFDASGNATGEVRTSYLNNNDLGSGRDMHFLAGANGKLAAYVTNYGAFDQNPVNAYLAANKINPGATVCMEYSPIEGQSNYVVKFFVFAGNGNGANAPQVPSANLDGFGEKFVPNLCLNCHGGSYSPSNPASPTAAELDMKSSFRELDTATYRFPSGLFQPTPAEKAAFHQQNDLVKALHPGQGSPPNAGTRQAIRDLITGWYQAGNDDQDNTWTPNDWLGQPQQGLYHDVVAGSCRTCHVAFDDDSSQFGIQWTTYAQLKFRRSSGLLADYVLCQSRFMPHAVVTWRNFWLSSNPHKPAALRDYQDGTNWPQIGSCP